MIAPHGFHTSTLLPDGRVLVAGGLIDDRLDGILSDVAEVYDPRSASWTATEPMTTARWGHTATLLPDGRVLVAGSYFSGTERLASAELFDPSSGRWQATGAMKDGRGGHTATLLHDGRVLVVGGAAESMLLEGGPRSALAEIYDTATGEWTRTGSLIEPRKGFSATLLHDGRVLVAGGDGRYRATELYDPASGRWIPTASMTEGRFGHTATLLFDGTVVVAGGCACSDPGGLATAERYDPDTATWAATGSMAVPRIFHTATLLRDGAVLVVNEGLAGERPASAERYDPDSGRWTTVTAPALTRYGYAATLLLDGSVLVTGDYFGSNADSAELYQPGNAP